MSATAILASSMVNSRSKAIVEDGTIGLLVSDRGDVTSPRPTTPGSPRPRRCTPRSRRRTTPAPGSSTVGEPVARRVQVHAAVGHARRRLRRQGARRRRDDLPVHGHRAHDRLLGRGLSDYGYWKVLTPINLITDSVAYAVLSSAGVAGEAASYTFLIDHNDLRSSVEAHLLNAPVTTSGDITVSANEVAELTAFDEASSARGRARPRSSSPT